MTTKSSILVVVVLAYLQLAVVHSTPISAVCPPNSKHFGNMCYSFHTSRKTWVSANAECKLLGGQLATIGGLSLNNFLYNQYRKSSYKDVWIGYKKCNSKWCHPDGKTAAVFHLWNINEPNNMNGYENCVEMWNNGKWNDQPCWDKRPYICEVDVDECALGIHNCQEYANCTNTVGSYFCTCDKGFVAQGTVCEATHNKIFKEVVEHDEETEKELTNIEYLLQKLLGTSKNTSKLSSSGK